VSICEEFLKSFDSFLNVIAVLDRPSQALRCQEGDQRGEFFDILPKF
jgi:hypothetical protein